MTINILDKIQLVDIDMIVPYEHNAKKHPQKQVNLLAKQIKLSGWDQPIVVDEDLVILKGHCRRLAAYKLGLTKVPITINDGLSDAQKQAARLADNKLAESEWDLDELKFDLFELEQNISREEIGINLNDLGFEDKELIKLGIMDDPDQISEVSDQGPIEYLIVIECENEVDQQQLFEELRERNLKCKIMS